MADFSLGAMVSNHAAMIQMLQLSDVQAFALGRIIGGLISELPGLETLPDQLY